MILPSLFEEHSYRPYGANFQNTYDMYAQGSLFDEQKTESFFIDMRNHEIVENIASNGDQNLMNEANKQDELN